MKVVFLYTELADYFLSCCRELAKIAEIHIVRWPVNKEAPFRFTFPEGVKVYDKNDYTQQQLAELVNKLQPDILVCSGWIDKDYLKIVKPWFGKIPTVLTCDTHWKGTVKQYIATILSRVILKRRFSHVWVPGTPQEVYAGKLGFNREQIKKGFYSCDLQKFNSLFEKHFPEKENAFPKVLLYAGRYYDFKGIEDLWKAFSQLCEEEKTDWELWCLGTGTIQPFEHPRIKHFGFVQPEDLEPILRKAGVFVLPSRFEPWGVVVHEYAAAGFPLILSDAVGAAEAFLEEGRNGFSFKKENVAELKQSLKNMLSLNSVQLAQMGRHSHMLAQRISPHQWAETLRKIYDDAHR